ncbi:MAG: FAD-dependent oxidoreductase [Sphaerochaeta sp.]|nr:FAD-dependent oxidoreductase [Sphaerochaeta sp.]
MGMRNFEHISVKTLDEAARLLASQKHKVSAIAGGTDLLGILKDDVHPEYPEALIDLKTIEGLDFIRQDPKGITIGAMTNLSTIFTSNLIQKTLPLLSEAAHAVASPQVRNMGTLGGNLCQEPRCWYYRNYNNAFHCLRKDGDNCPALTGENRFHSVFGSMRVGTPSCCSSCPDSIDIPLYMEKIRAGEIEEASAIILEHNPMPAITGRVCPHFCEQGCNRKEQDSPVSIRSVERHIGDYLLEQTKRHTPSAARAKGKKVAVVGGGPAGLSCAYYLQLKGYEVTIFEKQPKLGGMLRYGIPDFRLSAQILDKQIEALLIQGIKVKTDAKLGKDFSLASLKAEGYQSIFLALGSWKAKEMGIPKESHPNILTGLSFLERVKLLGPPTLTGTVAVVGGGNTAIDAARTALRSGAEKVVLLYRRTRLEMPAENEEIEDAEKEGIELHFLVAPKHVVTENSTLTGLQCCRMELGAPDSSGRPRPVEIKDSEFLFPADWIISAIGQTQDLEGLDSELKRSAWNGIESDSETFATNIPGLYAGGDVVSGPATVVEAIAAGRKAALAIEEYLQGKNSKIEKKLVAGPQELHTINEKALVSSPRISVDDLDPQERTMIKEDYKTVDFKRVSLEAYRCIDCSCVAVNASDLAPALLTLEALIKTTKRTIAAQDFFTVRSMATTVLADDELVSEIFIPTPLENTTFNFQKFRIRNSIDFPMVSVASCLTFEKGKIQRARIAFGAVAPIPFRARSVEEFLIGKEATEEIAALAGELAVKDSFPLEKNRYKLTILKGLLRKAILTV